MGESTTTLTKSVKVIYVVQDTRGVCCSLCDAASVFSVSKVVPKFCYKSCFCLGIKNHLKLKKKNWNFRRVILIFFNSSFKLINCWHKLTYDKHPYCIKQAWHCCKLVSNLKIYITINNFMNVIKLCSIQFSKSVLHYSFSETVLVSEKNWKMV